MIERFFDRIGSNVQACLCILFQLGLYLHCVALFYCTNAGGPCTSFAGHPLCVLGANETLIGRSSGTPSVMQSSSFLVKFSYSGKNRPSCVGTV